METIAHDALVAMLDRLKLTAIRDQLDSLLDEAARSEMTLREALGFLVAREIARRDERRIEMATKIAQFPFVRELDGFEWGAQPSLDQRQLRELASCRWIAHGDALQKGVRIALELDDVPAVRGDRVQLQQVLLNILLNAFDSMQACGPNEREVTVRATVRDDGFVLIAVRDAGPGLSEDQIERIFQPFYTTKRDGLGMGLSICRSIIKAHGGALWVENNPDRGATFYFTLPMTTTEWAAG